MFYLCFCELISDLSRRVLTCFNRIWMVIFWTFDQLPYQQVSRKSIGMQWESRNSGSWLVRSSWIFLACLLTKVLVPNTLNWGFSRHELSQGEARHGDLTASLVNSQTKHNNIQRGQHLSHKFQRAEVLRKFYVQLQSETKCRSWNSLSNHVPSESSWPVGLAAVYLPDLRLQAARFTDTRLASVSGASSSGPRTFVAKTWSKGGTRIRWMKLSNRTPEYIVKSANSLDSVCAVSSNSHGASQ